MRERFRQSLELLRSLNKDAAIITTPIENLDGKKLVEVMEHPDIPGAGDA